MGNTRVFDYFYNCLRKACLYFSIPTLKAGEFLKEDKKDDNLLNHSVDNSRCEVESDCDVSVEESAESTEFVSLHCSNELESEDSCVTGTESDASIKPHEMIDRAIESTVEISDLEASTEVLDDAKPNREDTLDGKVSIDLTDDVSEVGSKCSASDECSTDNDPAVDTAECKRCDTMHEDKARETNDSCGSVVDDTDISNNLAEGYESIDSEPAVQAKVDKGVSTQHNEKMDFTEVAERLISKIIDSLKTDSRLSVLTEKIEDSEDTQKCEAVIKKEESDTKNSESDECISKSDSDNESGTLDTSPEVGDRQKGGIVCQKNENQYNFIFSQQTLTDGKVKYSVF